METNSNEQQNEFRQKPSFYNSDEFNNPLNIPSLSDEEALTAHEHLCKFKTWEEKIKFVYETTGFDSLFYTAIRIIDDRYYEFGILKNPEMRNSEIINALGQFTFNVLREQILEDMAITCVQAFKKYEDDEPRQLEIAYEQIKWIEEKAIKAKPAFDNNIRKYGFFDREWYIGYRAEAMGIRPLFEVDNFNKRIVSVIANGAACYEFRYKLEKNLNEYKANKNHDDKPKEPTLESIFIKSEYYQACLDILSNYSFIELGPKTGASVFFGITDAFKTYSRRLLKPTPQETWSDEMIVNAFNSHLATNFGGKKREIKRGGGLQKKVKAEVEAILSKL